MKYDKCYRKFSLELNWSRFFKSMLRMGLGLDFKCMPLKVTCIVKVTWFTVLIFLNINFGYASITHNNTVIK